MSCRLECPTLMVEYQTTRDLVVDDGSGWRVEIVPPPGLGWVVADSSSDRRTRWRRLWLVDACEPIVRRGLVE